jgi:hypothetical protein
VDLTRVIEVHPEVLVVKYGLDRVVGGVISLVLAASGRLDKEILLNFSRASADEDPSVQALAGVLIIRLVVGLVIIDSDSSLLFIMVLLGCTFLGLFIEFRLADRLLNDLESLVFLLLFLPLGCLLFIFVN